MPSNNLDNLLLLMLFKNKIRLIYVECMQVFIRFTLCYWISHEPASFSNGEKRENTRLNECMDYMWGRSCLLVKILSGMQAQTAERLTGRLPCWQVCWHVRRKVGRQTSKQADRLGWMREDSHAGRQTCGQAVRQVGNKADGRYATYLENTDLDVAVATHARSTHTNTVVFMLTVELCVRLFKSEGKNHCQLPITPCIS